MSSAQENQQALHKIAMGVVGLTTLFVPVWVFGFLVGQQFG